MNMASKKQVATSRMMTTREAADELGVSIRQLQTLIERGQLTASKFGHVYMVSSDDLEAVRVRPKGRPRKDAVK